ncbi:MAG: hypothetical protein WAV07_11275, partial [Candidatus Contendobacter sp.]
MSKRIILSLWFCTLLGACALNSGLVVAQVASGPEYQVRSAAVGGPVEPATPPVVASLNARQELEVPKSAGDSQPAAADEMEPAAPAEALPQPAETVAAPPPLPPCPASAANLASRIADQICQRVRTDPPPTSLKADGRTLRSLESTIRFYAQR